MPPMNARAPATPRPVFRGLGWLTPRPAEADPLLDNPGDDLRAGSTFAQTARKNSTPVEPRALNDVMAELRAIGGADPAVQTKLMEDMQRTDPSLWPLLIDTYKSTVAFQRTGAQSTRVAAAAPPAGAPADASKSPRTALAVPAVSAADQVVIKETPPPQSPGAENAVVTAAPAAASAVASSATLPPTTPGAGEPPTLSAAQQAAAPAPSSAAVQVTTLDRSAGPPAASPVQQASYNAPRDPVTETALGAAIAAMEKQAQESSGATVDVARQAHLRMLYLAAGRREDALRPIVGASPAEQDYWNNQLASLATWLDVPAMPETGQRAAIAHQRLTEAAARLGQLSPLVVHNLAFCTEVASYGVITRFKENEFTPGQQALLYAEVDNFQSEESPKGYHTALKSSYKIVDKEGKEIAKAEPQEVEEYCEKARRDYFVRYRLTMPTPLPDGVYSLQLTIEDMLGKKVGTSAIDFTIKEKK